MTRLLFTVCVEQGTRKRDYIFVTVADLQAWATAVEDGHIDPLADEERFIATGAHATKLARIPD